MLRLLDRSVAAAGERLVLLAPPQAPAQRFFRNVDVDRSLHESLLSEMQRLRGGVYVQDGAISPGQLVSGRHQTPEDERSWHLLIMDRQQRVSACVWYMAHPRGATLDSLRVRTCPLRASEGWGPLFKSAVDSELARARALGLGFAEIGGWAVAPAHRGRAEGLLLALAAFSLGRLSGGSLGLTTATVRHGSATILRGIGGSHLTCGDGAIPPYYDPRYDCEMELLRFDSRNPSPKFEPLIDELKTRLAYVPVIASTELETPVHHTPAVATEAALFAA
jgi:hypothetical protein